MRQVISIIDSANDSALRVEIAARIAGDSDLNDKIDGVDSSLRTIIGDLPIESGDSATLVAAKAYTDQEVLSLSQDVSAGDSALNARIDAIIANTDSVALNSLAELVEEFQSADNSLSAMISSNNAMLNSLQAQVSGNDGDINGLNGRVNTLESEMDNVQDDIIQLPGLIKSQIIGGLCITTTVLENGNVEVKVDEQEALEALNVKNSIQLGGENPDHYRINVYNVAGTMVN